MSEQKKWTSTAGPIQTKKASSAISDILFEGRNYVELSGVKGVSESSYSYYSPFSPPSKPSVEAYNALGEQFAWAVTRENYQQVIEASGVVIAALRLNRPVKDSRRTVEDDNELTRKREEVEAKNQQAEAEKHAKVAALVPQLRAKYPWATGSNGASVQAAANAKAELGMTFPGIDFSCRKDGYNAIRVRWEMGPTEKQVTDLLSKYRHSHFDGMQDLTITDHSAERKAMDIVLGGVSYVSASRELSPAALETVQAAICKLAGVEVSPTEVHSKRFEFDHNEDTLGCHAYRLLARTSFPAGATVRGILTPGAEWDAWTDEMLATYGPGFMSADPSVMLPEHAAKKVEYEALNDLPGGFERYVLDLEAPAAAPVTAAPTGSGPLVSYNLTHNGVEIRFPTKPSRETLDLLKHNGFRWTPRGGAPWYKRYTPSVWRIAHELMGLPVAEEPVSRPDRFEMEAEDRMAQTCGV